ncbi:hypothetical protein PGTUg99_036066 [Puccinia graminis f. sp. tritici]|uniref:Uncharacterized protein n=1 Tax=Puccinia graminis f. sp. tritici TaxID=56615 RepID=A0A5B0RAD7_PUCGR|nr:hypothetical protein PGTUg99_036066 [Puccinia graminis f. sp. tritici]
MQIWKESILHIFLLTGISCLLVHNQNCANPSEKIRVITSSGMSECPICLGNYYRRAELYCPNCEAVDPVIEVTGCRIHHVYVKNVHFLGLKIKP